MILSESRCIFLTHAWLDSKNSASLPAAPRPRLPLRAPPICFSRHLHRVQNSQSNSHLARLLHRIFRGLLVLGNKQ